MSAPTPKHKPAPTKSKHLDVSIANVFDESSDDHQPARRPLVVEIESTPPAATPYMAPSAPQVNAAVETQPTPSSVPQSFVEPTLTPPAFRQPSMVPPAPIAQEYRPTPVQAPPHSVEPMQTDPVLPSFFEQDLKGSVPEHATSPVSVAAPVVQAPPTPQPFVGIPAQAVVGEIAEESSGGNAKKWVGIALIIVAIILLSIGLLALYAKRLMTPVSVPSPTPLSQPTARPTLFPSTTPAATASAKPATASGTLKELKAKYKVDVLNGTKVAGLASKQASLVKTAGYTTGTVGNGKPESAGTIVVPTGATAMGTDLQTVLADFTFTISEEKTAKAVVVTLGQPKATE